MGDKRLVACRKMAHQRRRTETTRIRLKTELLNQQRALGSSLSARLQSAGSPSPGANVGAFLFSGQASSVPPAKPRQNVALRDPHQIHSEINCHNGLISGK